MGDDPTPSTSPMVPGSTDTTQQPAMSSSAAAPAKKKQKRKTPEEKLAEERERALKKAKKEEEMAAKAKEKEVKEAAKAVKAAEKEEEMAVKAKEKEAKEAAKAAKTAEKEEKERKKKEEEDRKKRAQPSIFGFFKSKPAALGEVSPNQQPSVKTVNTSPVRAKLVTPVMASPSAKEAKPDKSAYDKLFQPFFVKSDVRVAGHPSHMDTETMAAKSKTLDEYIRGERGEVNTKPFNPISAFNLSGLPTTRGRPQVAVKKIMTEIFGDALDSESQQARLTRVQDDLNCIPIKVLRFWEDVRPAYVGTVTSTPQVQLYKLARKPTGRLLKLNYDYDSEAEWEEEEGEDLDEEDLEDEDHEGEEEMGDFLDDAEDVSAARPGFLGDAEPVSTGICYENRKRLAHNVSGEVCPTVYKYRMEFLLESLEHHHSIDPFSTEYWQPKVAPAATSSQQSKAMKPLSHNIQAGMAPPPLPGSSPADPSSSSQPDWSAMVPKSMFPEFKRAIISTDYNFLTKVGIVDMLSKKFSTATKNQVKATLDFLAERSSLPGAKKSAKVWVLRSEHALDKD
ncbi:putative ATP-dependent RNA helicase ucp12 [Pestalotiopsis sp. IQ-011]